MQRMTAADVMEGNWRTNGKPENRSTITIQSFPPQWKMSAPNASKGNVDGLHGETTAAGLEGLMDWQVLQVDTILSMSLDMPGQK